MQNFPDMTVAVPAMGATGCSPPSSPGGGGAAAGRCLRGPDLKPSAGRAPQGEDLVARAPWRDGAPQHLPLQLPHHPLHAGQRL